MQKQRLLLTIIVVMMLQSICVQGVIRGIVVDKETSEPIIGATISDAGKRNPLTITDAEGRFSIPKNNYPKQIKITYIGYKSLISKLTDKGRYELEAEVSKLGEVVVTAQESHGLTSASKIEKHAMEHLQPSSFADLMELLPGGRSSDPSLTTPNTIHIREIPITSSNYSTSSLGTSFVMDGAPISTNANMQYLAGAWDAVATDRDNVNAGVDMRTIPTDDIESVEIVRGIPSVEYGDLTSGLVKIERRQGGHDLNFRLKSDMGSKLFYAAKGFECKAKRLSLNLSADYLNAKADPRNRLENYKRLTLSARLHKTWEQEAYHLGLTANLDYTGSFDNDKVDPDLNHSIEDSYRSSYNRYAALVSLQMKMKRSMWLKSVETILSSSYEYNLTERTRLVQLSRMTVAPLAKEEGENDAYILPFKYMGHHETEGKPLNVYVKMNGRLQIPSNMVSNTLLLGVDWNLDKNLGRGQVFDPYTPVYTGRKHQMAYQDWDR